VPAAAAAAAAATYIAAARNLGMSLTLSSYHYTNRELNIEQRKK